LKVLSEIPKVTFTNDDTANPLLLTAQVVLAAGGEISWDFGDGSARQLGASQQHNYAKPGRYNVSLRVVRNGHLSEFQADVVVSRTHMDRLTPPVTAFPKLTRGTGMGIPSGHTRVVGTVKTPADDPVTVSWRIERQDRQKGNRVTFDLKPGDYTLSFRAVRRIKACIYSTQRFITAPTFQFKGLSLATNRRFKLDGTETTGVDGNPPANLFTKHLFDSEVLSPIDEWTLEIPVSDNAFLRTVSATDVEQFDLSEIGDVVLALEYESTPGGS
jgi:hypothetical protein